MTRGEEMRAERSGAERMVGNARVGRVWVRRRCEGR